MSLGEAQISQIVERVLAKVKDGGAPGVPASLAQYQEGVSVGRRGVFKSMDQAIEAAKIGQKTWAMARLDDRRRVIDNVRRRLRENARLLSEMAVAETGLGRVEDKVNKNLLVINKTPGTEYLEPTAWTGDDGLTLMERPPTASSPPSPRQPTPLKRSSAMALP